MNLLLDMGLAPRTADFLRQLGHDASHLRERGLEKLADQEIVRLAEAERRVVVTFDLDFARIVALQRLARPSIVLFRLERFTTDELNSHLARLLTTYESHLTAGAILVVDSHRLRIRSLPIW
jgi:predicted nuclease of predicted toxin-antitoxin system